MNLKRGKVTEEEGKGIEREEIQRRKYRERQKERFRQREGLGETYVVGECEQFV